MKKIAVLLSVIVALGICLAFTGCGGQNSARSNYQIDISLSDNKVTGKETVEFFNNSENVVTQLKFNLFANAFRSGAKYSPISAQYTARAYPNGINYGQMQINNVFSSDGALEFSICGEDQNILTVNTGKDIYPDERFKLTIEFSVDIANVIARTGYNDKTINLANFYPILCALTEEGFYECIYYSNGDPFFSDCADYTVTLTTDSEYIVASSGSIVKTAQNGNERTSTYKIENARSFAFVLSKEFETITDNSTGVQINYYYYDDENAIKSIEYAVKSIKAFNQVFGEYPYDNYSVVQTPFVQGGMEFPALVMISDELKDMPYGEVIVHETAHQWWQTTVGNNEVEYGFLDEGLAEYSVILFYEKYPEFGYKREELISDCEKTYKIFCSVFDKLFGKVNTQMIRSLKDFSGEYEYVNISYIKPCIMYDYLRKTIGEDKFFKGLKRYYTQYKFLNATPYDLVGSFEKVGADVNGFFESFYNGKVII